MWTPVFSALSRLLVTAPAKLAVAALTLGLLGGGVFGTLHLDMEFKPEWLMDHNSEGRKAYQREEMLHSYTLMTLLVFFTTLLLCNLVSS